MKVYLAGFNVDAAVLRELEEKYGRRPDLTPEVLSAAYARISRDPRSIEEIRKDSRQEVQRARKSNSTIIFKMGHHSVAEHAVFNLDITGVSRYAMEELEKFPDQIGKHLKYSHFWSLRIGDYRAIYEIKRNEKKVIVLFIGHRDDVYEDFSKLF